MTEAGFEPDAVINYMYVEGRNRYWIGLHSYYGNFYRTQFDPLYSLQGISLPLSLEFDKRKSNFVGLDLMHFWAPTLLELPFDKKKVSDLYEKERRKVTTRQFSNASPEIIEFTEALEPLKPWPGEVDKITAPVSLEIAKSLNVTPFTYSGVVHYWPQVLDIIRNDNQMSQIYNVTNLEKLNMATDDDFAAFTIKRNIISTAILSGKI